MSRRRPSGRCSPTVQPGRPRPARACGRLALRHHRQDGAIITGFTHTPLHPEDLHAWHVLRPLLDAGPYLPWSSGALRPAALVTVCNEIVLNRRSRVVECGSGSGTVVLARLLRQLGHGGTLTSLEHDAGWAGLVTGMLARESLDGVARVVHAPLDGDPPWYARSATAEAPPAVDLLLVDGPPAWAPGHGLRRAPALAAFDDRLTADASVYLDDADRPGEQQVLQQWQRRPGWRFTTDATTGLAHGVRDEAPAVDGVNG